MKFVFLMCTIALAGCSYSNLNELKSKSCDRWKSIGYECIGYEGYQWGLWYGGRYGGAHVWHSLRRDGAPGIIYSGYTSMWGDEIHIYGPRAIDALKGQ